MANSGSGSGSASGSVTTAQAAARRATFGVSVDLVEVASRPDLAETEELILPPIVTGIATVNYDVYFRIINKDAGATKNFWFLISQTNFLRLVASGSVENNKEVELNFMLPAGFNLYGCADGSPLSVVGRAKPL